MILDDDLTQQLRAGKYRWLITGSAGFIGSHLLETLLANGQSVTSLDNFATGHRSNLEEVRQSVGADAWARHRFMEADIADADACRTACQGVDFVLHQAALGSVPRSINDPMGTHRANADGFLCMLIAARDAKARRFVYAASSSTYGDSAALPKVEDKIGRPLSPYAVTKYLNELYADVFGRCYGIATIGLRYFNVFGPRQDPNGSYAAVIPRWAKEMLDGTRCVINGDGETSRDFCFVANAVQANLQSALTSNAGAFNQVFNVAVGERTSLNQLHARLSSALTGRLGNLRVEPPFHAEERAGDVRHSLADISKAKQLLGYQPTHDVRQGLEEAADWYVRRFAASK